MKIKMLSNVDVNKKGRRKSKLNFKFCKHVKPVFIVWMVPIKNKYDIVC